MAIQWSKTDGKQVLCPKCGEPAKPGQIGDYGLYDDMTYYYTRECRKCQTKHAVLSDISMTETFEGEGKFKPL